MDALEFFTSAGLIALGYLILYWVIRAAVVSGIGEADRRRQLAEADAAEFARSEGS